MEGTTTGGAAAGDRFRCAGMEAMVGRSSGVAVAIHAMVLGAMQIELAKGRVRIEGSADAGLLRVVLERLRG